MDKKQIEYYFNRDALLKVLEDAESRCAGTYDSALESITILNDRVSKVDEGEGKDFWTNNLRNLSKLFQICEILMGENQRLRGSLKNMSESYWEVTLKYRELEEKYNRLTDKLIQ